MWQELKTGQPQKDISPIPARARERSHLTIT